MVAAPVLVKILNADSVVAGCVALSLSALLHGLRR
jgi:hypothetical protein